MEIPMECFSSIAMQWVRLQVWIAFHLVTNEVYVICKKSPLYCFTISSETLKNDIKGWICDWGYLKLVNWFHYVVNHNWAICTESSEFTANVVEFGHLDEKLYRGSYSYSIYWFYTLLTVLYHHMSYHDKIPTSYFW